MNLTKLFDTQRILDERIVQQKGLEGRDMLPNKILALLVELGELANEERSWKFWSEDRESRTHIDLICSPCWGTGDINSEANAESMMEGGSGIPYEECEYCKGTGKDGYKNPLLVEYVDCLHFILSIGLEIGIHHFVYKEDHNFKESNITQQFLSVMDYAIMLRDDDYCSELLKSFVYLGEMLGFTWEQIETAYFEKNKINHSRQDNGY